MAEHPAVFRDYGILPDQLQPPAAKVRGYFSPGRIVGQYVATGLFAALGIAVVALVAWGLPTPLNWFGSVSIVAGFVVFLHLMTRFDFGVVELEGNVLRAQHLYTGMTIERQVQEIACLVTVLQPGDGVQKAVTEQLLGRIKGVEVRFRDRRTPLSILRSDPAMTNAQELIEAILYRMSQIAELEPTISDKSGRPIVQNIHWKGEESQAKSGPSWQLLTALTMALFLLFAPILGGAGCQQQELLAVSSQPVQEMTLSALIQNGPGVNRHVAITDFQFGGYYYETDRSGVWSQVWIAAFPAAGPGNEIEAVVWSNSIRNENALRQFVQLQKITGACSLKKRTSWGVTLGPELVKANGNLPLKAAWNIDELDHPPSREVVQAFFIGSYACFAMTLLLAAIILGSEVVVKISG